MNTTIIPVSWVEIIILIRPSVGLNNAYEFLEPL